MRLLAQNISGHQDDEFIETCEGFRIFDTADNGNENGNKAFIILRLHFQSPFSRWRCPVLGHNPSSAATSSTRGASSHTKTETGCLLLLEMLVTPPSLLGVWIRLQISALVVMSQLQLTNSELLAYHSESVY